MVRLKVMLSLGVFVTFVFQFHYGTIKGTIRSSHIGRGNIFQFHYGTIKGSTPTTLTVTFAHFNSTMVRLKVDYFPIAPGLKQDFNSTMVRLKVFVACAVFSSFTDFNSTMVRLKVVPQIKYSPGKRFQFHYGTIKGLLYPRLPVNLTLFQFHYGTIKGSAPQNIELSPYISIPLWYD